MTTTKRILKWAAWCVAIATTLVLLTFLFFTEIQGIGNGDVHIEFRVVNLHGQSIPNAIIHVSSLDKADVKLNNPDETIRFTEPLDLKFTTDKNGFYSYISKGRTVLIYEPAFISWRSSFNVQPVKWRFYAEAPGYHSSEEWDVYKHLIHWHKKIKSEGKSKYSIIFEIVLTPVEE